jgi:hypothetical protein
VRVLITGTSARTSSGNRTGTLATAMSWALLNAGASVTLRVPTEDTDADKIFVGLSSPTAPVSNYTYAGYALLAEAHKTGRLAGVFVDQPSPSAIRSGAKTALDDYSRLSAAFYSKRPDYSRYCGDRSFRDKVHAGMSLYLNEPLPVLAPMYPWGREDALASRLPQGHHVLPVDPTGTYLDLIELLTLDIPRKRSGGRVWLMETAYAKPPKVKLGSLPDPLITVKSPADTQDFASYGSSAAVLEGDTPIRGWWTPTAAAALMMGAAFVGGPHTGHEFVAPYISDIQDMDASEHADLAHRQLQHLRSNTWSMKSMADFLMKTHNDSPQSSVKAVT